MGHGTASRGSSHVTASFGDTSMMFGSKARLSQVRISLIDAKIPSSRDSTAVIKRSSRPSSVKEPQKKNETIETDCSPQEEQQEDIPSCSESMDDVPPLQ